MMIWYLLIAAAGLVVGGGVVFAFKQKAINAAWDMYAEASDEVDELQVKMQKLYDENKLQD